MRMNLFSKLLALLFVLIIVPLFIVSYVLISDAKNMGEVAVAEAMRMGADNLADSTQALNNLGADIIRQKADDTAKQVEIYIKSHPQMTVADLQADEAFAKIAVQPVGKTGYTALTDVETLVCRFHSSPGIVNLDLATLSEKLPGFWSVMSKSQGGNPTEGYYDWAEKDGSIKQKYMYISIADAVTADNVRFSIAATTYIDEFSQPSKIIEDKNKATLAGTVQSLTQMTRNMYSKQLILLILDLILAVIIGFWAAHSISSPIKKLKIAADKATMGDFDTKMPLVKSNDEVSELIASTEMLIAALKNKS